MAQHVRALLPEFRHFLKIFFDDKIDSTGIEPFSLCREEHCVHRTARQTPPIVLLPPSIAQEPDALSYQTEESVPCSPCR